ncbi:MAG: CpaF family protein [Candidatus Nitricoxidivorans perseverans]|uniref:CpaF family protein n=1 Tax=Candidatus Nitricoxidivorans perseverans TaxID=2975601 RepID=A0AA49IX34_9PROT|nr:MAG: CpaF family protein [Candidatus Nitricoxidivorans perseverans]
MSFANFGYDYSLKHSETYQDIKLRLHHYLIDRLEEERVPVGEMSKDDLAGYVRGKVSRYVADHRLAVTANDTEQLAREMVDELTGYGPLEKLIHDDQVNDILVNGCRHIFIERAGRLQHSDLRFIDDDHVLRVIRRILAPLGRRLDESSPMVDARLPDGSRVNAIIPPVALNGPCLSIRKFRKDPLQAGDLLAFGTADQPVLDFLHKAVEKRCNILISGGTGAGKTTLLNVLSRYIPTDERLVTIEDAAELQLGHDHVVRLETRPPNIDGRGEVTSRDLVRNALRMRPDRIILGEVRGDEVMDVLQAMNTGHDGCMSTVHANSPRDALVRIEMLAGLAGFQGTDLTLKTMISTALDLIVQISRLPDGRRRLFAIEEVLGIRDGEFVSNALYEYRSDSDSFASLGMPTVAKLRPNGGRGKWR